MSPAFGNPTGTFAQQSQNNKMSQPFGGQNGQPQQGFGGQQQGGFGGQQQGGFGGQQQGGFGGFGQQGGFGGGFNPYQMQSPYGPQMGGFGGGFGGFGRGRGMGGFGGGFNNSDNFDERMMRPDVPRKLEGTPQPAENMPQQYSPEEYLKRGLQMQAQNASMNNRGGIEARPQYQDSNMLSAAVMPNEPRASTMDRPSFMSDYMSQMNGRMGSGQQGQQSQQTQQDMMRQLMQQSRMG